MVCFLGQRDLFSLGQEALTVLSMTGWIDGRETGLPKLGGAQLAECAIGENENNMAYIPHTLVVCDSVHLSILN